jgi:hypothetical protein
MIKADEDALICDLAETYHIYDYRQLPLNTIAVFSVGLRNNSRIKMKMNNQPVELDLLLLAGISDKLSTAMWWQTKDGQKGVNRPDSLVDVITNTQTKEKNVIAFSSGEDFINRRNELLKHTKKGGS